MSEVEKLWSFLTTKENDGALYKFQLLERSGTPVSFRNAMRLLRDDVHFRNCFHAVMTCTEFEAYRWETPCVTKISADRPFEFVLIDWPSFIHRSTDTRTFEGVFETVRTDDTVIAVPSLGKDATLIIPKPLVGKQAYGHLAAFMRKGPNAQVNELLHKIGNHVLESLGDKPLWLNTAGGGVAWLHVRVDSRPKYYQYTPYKDMEWPSRSSSKKP